MSLDPDCLARLKLRQPPFDPSPSEEFLYSDPLLESLIETASRAMTAPSAIVILAGASGSGRSIQLMRLLGTLADRFDLIAFRGRPEIPFDAVDLTIRNHLRAGGFDDPSRSLTDLLRDRGRAGDSIVLAIDDAHFLGMESIRQLLRMRSEMLEAKGQGLRLVLVGDLSLSRGRLPLTDPADENQVVRLNLRPFNLEQAGAYLRHRLRVAGIDDPESFLTSGDIAVLQTNSKGMPAALNENANAWLTRRCRSAGAGKQSVVGKLGGLVTQSAAASSPQRETPKAVEPSNTEPESLLLPPEDLLDLDEDVFEPSDPQLSDFLRQEDRRADSSDFEQVLRHVRNHELTQKRLAVESESTVSPAPQPEPSARSEPYWNRRWFIPAVVTTVLLAIVGPVAFQLFGDRSSDPLLRGSEPSPDKASTVMSPPPQSETANEVQSDGSEGEGAATTSSQGAGAGSASPAQDVASEISVPEVDRPERAEVSDGAVDVAERPLEVAEPAVPLTPFDEDLAWLRRQDTGRLTIQLVAARDLKTAREFVRRHELNGAHYVQTRSFVIAVVGSFPNRSAAKQMLSELPEGARSSGPWIRSIGSVLDSQK
ncbi:Sporulation domain-containing protein [Thiorhodococcus drewsii AZ1]|uniref:Sporulation domain-containing protein n=1 Tax=Thiorhodococcus drewsii AZ1 TaxID=765913 RepID=G2E317_9GAMM|nr:AAA family ATPase [Thiorhodococcus drewsii]EGV30479.1 Sporulation domain-containing protein [Thiorhodococcus drewsii AZ1]